MDSYFSLASLAGSVFSTLATAYFWLVRMRQERPSLRPYLLDKEFFLGVSRDQTRQVGLKVGVIVANYSVLPNAILGARVWVRLNDGWSEVTQLSFDKQTPLPFNMPPLHTVLLRLNGTITFAYQDDLEQGNKTLPNYVSRFVTSPLEFKIELQRLGEQVDTHILTMSVHSEAAPATRTVAA